MAELVSEQVIDKSKCVGEWVSEWDSEWQPQAHPRLTVTVINLYNTAIYQCEIDCLLVSTLWSLVEISEEIRGHISIIFPFEVPVSFNKFIFFLALKENPLFV